MRKFIAGLLVVALLAVPVLAGAAGLTLTKQRTTSMGVYKVTMADVLFDNSYAGSGGEALTAATLGLTSVDFVMITPDSTGAAGYNFGYANAKLWCGGLENTLAIDPAAVTHVVTYLGANMDYVGVKGDSAVSILDTVSINVLSTDGTIAYEEMDAETDLSAVKVSIMAFGK